jgi:hypothetical protein
MPSTFDPATLQPHLYANQFDIIEDGEEVDAAFEALKASIAKTGIKMPIKLFEGKVLDGLNRLKAALAVGHKFTARDFYTFIGTQEDAKACVDAANIHRRHHSKEQKDRLIRAKIAEHPNASNRQITRRGVSLTRVNNVRKPSKTKDDKQLEKLERGWEGLDDQHRERFVEKYAADLREMLADYNS